MKRSDLYKEFACDLLHKLINKGVTELADKPFKNKLEELEQEYCKLKEKLFIQYKLKLESLKEDQNQNTSNNHTTSTLFPNVTSSSLPSLPQFKNLSQSPTPASEKPEENKKQMDKTRPAKVVEKKEVARNEKDKFSENRPMRNFDDCVKESFEENKHDEIFEEDNIYIQEDTSLSDNENQLERDDKAVYLESKYYNSKVNDEENSWPKYCRKS
ncbi:unnamed protein product [Moneuplotes crassus]|uniref:Uncharacterized protein n=1 Tax=Euplotes crassus TaxID=5936 RepID=A0AAD1Y701_EUPCR|nr:unnamed protein product [Moneuplotes crassus]